MQYHILPRHQQSVKNTQCQGVVNFAFVVGGFGNDAPLLWMLHTRGYDVNSLRRKETETEKALRLANERIAQLENEREIERKLIRELRA